MGDYKEAQEKTLTYFSGGYNCCESVVMAVCDHLGIDKEIPQKIATPFGAGMSKNGSNCGALNAAFICLGLVKGRSSSEDSKDASFIPADSVFGKFKEKYGSALCYDITGLDMKRTVETEEEKHKRHNELCGPLVAQTTQWILEELDKE
jgi:C_GCAxxG_C_C family probable redox protein